LGKENKAAKNIKENGNLADIKTAKTRSHKRQLFFIG
jgi:hypothetical protein